MYIKPRLDDETLGVRTRDGEIEEGREGQAIPVK